MSELAVRVEGLGKRYRIGERKASYQTMRESLVDLAAAPLRGLKALLRGESAGSSDDMIWALKNVSFSVRRGEVVGVIGRNGAGKSTLLKILSQITKPTEGTVDLAGRVGSLLEVGTGFHPELTGRENIFLNGAILGMKRADIERRFDEIVAFAEVERFLDTPVKHYSSGMYVRLAFAVAAYLEPDILLVDEVLAVGDAAFQRKCVRKMGEVGTEGRTVVIVSHNMQLVRSLCDRCVVLDSGNVVADGGVSESVGTYFDRIGAFDRSMAQARTGVANKALIEAVRAVHTEHHDHRELELGFKIVCLEDVESVSLGFSIHDEEGRTMVVSYSGPRTLFSLSAGAHLIRARVWDLPITPGLYTVRARMESSGSELDWPKGDLGQFEVPSLDREQCTRSEVVKNGQLLLSPEWNIESLEGEDER